MPVLAPVSANANATVSPVVRFLTSVADDAIGFIAVVVVFLETSMTVTVTVLSAAPLLLTYFWPRDAETDWADAVPMYNIAPDTSVTTATSSAENFANLFTTTPF